MRRRGQAALEFLTTYGWAFLIIIVMIGAISYFGIINPSKFVPSRCSTSPEFSCGDFRILASTDNISMQLKQGVGKSIYVEKLNCTYADVTPPISVLGQLSVRGTTLTPTTAWQPRDTAEASCDFLPSSGINARRSEKIRITYELTYKLSTGGLNHTASGEIYSEVQ